jgi:DNA (cytosine-5)-methyltransferase 1
VNGLALCAGIGGLELGLKLALGDSYRTVCYVEREAYSAACLVKRMEEGFLDKAPIWDDIACFRGSLWRGTVDIISSGFPCQPYSLASRGRRRPDTVWDSIDRIIRECKPGIVFLENVSREAFVEPFETLFQMGFALAPIYEADPAEMGACHSRRRFFFLAHADSQGQLVRAIYEKVAGLPAYPEITRTIWDRWPELPRMDDGIPSRVERNRALGNAVVPIVAAKAFVELMKQVKA